jgi:transcription elongation GreA/GreB family factor
MRHEWPLQVVATSARPVHEPGKRTARTHLCRHKWRRLDILPAQSVIRVRPLASPLEGEVNLSSAASRGRARAENEANMSRAFVKETDQAVEELPERPISPHPNFVTAEGLAGIEATLARLQQEHAAAKAAQDGAALARLARNLRYWTSRRATAQVIAAPSSPAEVQFGSIVTILRDDGRRQTYRIVGEDEADPTRGTISYVSPVARALTGKKLGDVVRAGTSDAEVIEIR